MNEPTLDSLFARRDRPVLLDGATGTELARRGITTTLPLWSAHALDSEHGMEVLKGIHEDYARAGADILVTCTFRTTPRALGKAGREADWRTFNRRAVDCAREGARRAGRALPVAGGLAPLEDCYSPELVPEVSACVVEHGRQATLLAELGVDLILIETMNTAREALAALVAARETGLPVLLSLCPEPPCHLLSGEPLEDVVPDLVEEGEKLLRGLLINCRSPEILETVWHRFVVLAPGLPHGLYAHLGEPLEGGQWRLPERHEPERYAQWVRARIAEGARIVGGCCGTTPSHIAALGAAVG